MLPFGKTVERPLDDDLKLKAKAEWDEGRLVVQRNVSGGGGVTETFMPSVDGTRLTVDVEMSGGPGGIEFQRVYNHPKPHRPPAALTCSVPAHADWDRG